MSNENVVKKFFEIKEFLEDTIVLENNSLHAVLDITPILLNKGSLKHLETLTTSYKNFLDGMDFNLEIVIRTLNDNIEDKLRLLRERTIFKLKQEKKFSHVKEFRDFMDWLDTYTAKKCKMLKKRYVAVSVHTDDKNISLSDLRARLDAKVNQVVSSFGNFGLKDIVRLDDIHLKNLFMSYIYDNLYINEDY